MTLSEEQRELWAAYVAACREVLPRESSQLLRDHDQMFIAVAAHLAETEQQLAEARALCKELAEVLASIASDHLADLGIDPFIADRPDVRALLETDE